MKKLSCDRCGKQIGLSEDNEIGNTYYDVRRSSDNRRFGHKNEKYICEQCMRQDPRYKKENETSFSKGAGS